jgi:hypothetical protein
MLHWTNLIFFPRRKRKMTYNIVKVFMKFIYKRHGNSEDKGAKNSCRNFMYFGMDFAIPFLLIVASTRNTTHVSVSIRIDEHICKYESIGEYSWSPGGVKKYLG